MQRCLHLILLFFVSYSVTFGQKTGISERSVESELDKLYQTAKRYENTNLKKCVEYSHKVISKSIEYNLPEYKAKADLLICSSYYAGTNYDTLLSYCNAAVSFFTDSRQKSPLAWSYSGRGVILDILGKSDEAIDDFKNGLRIFEELGEKDGMVVCNNDLGVSAYMNGEFILAANYLTNGLDLAEAIQDTFGMIRANTCNGFFYKRQFQVEKANSYLQKALALSKQVGDKYWSSMVLGGIVSILKSEGKMEEAIEKNSIFLEQATNLGSDHLLVDAYSNQASILFHLKDFEGSKDFANQTLELIYKQNRLQKEATILNLLADIAISQNQYQQAKQYLDKVDSLDKISNKNQIEYNRLMVVYLKAKGEYEKAISFQDEYVRLKINTNNKDKAKAVAFIENGFVLGKKEAEINLLSQQNKLQQQALQTRKNVLIGFFILGSIVLGMMYRFYFLKKQMNGLLEKRIREKTTDLKTSNLKLEKKNEELKRFAHIASHDLKEPLRNISGFLHLIEQKDAEIMDETSKEYFSFVKTNAVQMNKLLEDALSYSLMKESIDVKRTIDLNIIIEQVRLEMDAKFPDKKITIVSTNLPHLQVLSSDMFSIFQNLIENGIKFNNNYKPIINIASVINDSDCVIMVSDNGIGIEEKYFNKIFGMFTRLHNRSKFNGSGLGLASCKKIVEKYKGKILVQSEPNAGSTFVISFPKSEVMKNRRKPKS